MLIIHTCQSGPYNLHCIYSLCHKTLESDKKTGEKNGRNLRTKTKAKYNKNVNSSNYSRVIWWFIPDQE